MAILYGTTADGDSLPVEVNEFGQLIAQGLQGQEGPPGPPGLPELPPDPFEGAILGWKDNTLSWLGGSVPIPEGTYGPIISYANGVLELETSVDLPSLASIFLSDRSGARYIYRQSTGAIAELSSPVFRPYNTSPPTAGLYSGSWDYVFNGRTDSSNTDTQSAYAYQGSSICTTLPLPSGSLEVYAKRPGSTMRQGNTITVGTKTIELDDNGTATWYNFGYQSDITQIQIVGTDPGVAVYAVRINGVVLNQLEDFPLILQDSTGLSDFEVGDLVQSSSSQSQGETSEVTAIDASVPSITVNGGTWAVGASVVGPVRSGDGTVQSTIANSIILREDNGEWRVGYYVTAPEQNLAARYVYTDEIRKRVL
jgi:hypothetical protein